MCASGGSKVSVSLSNLLHAARSSTGGAVEDFVPLQYHESTFASSISPKGKFERSEFAVIHTGKRLWRLLCAGVPSVAPFDCGSVCSTFSPFESASVFGSAFVSSMIVRFVYTSVTRSPGSREMTAKRVSRAWSMSSTVAGVKAA